jgi:plastocyanin
MSEQPRPSRRGPILVGALIAAPAIGLLVFALLAGLRTETIVIEVPAGTAERIAAGEDVELLPRVLEVSVGDRLEIRNQDTVAHDVGPYAVEAGQTLQQSFSSPGTLEGTCTLHDSGEFTIVVR